MSRRITELAAVNVGLAASGATPVTSLDNNNQPDVLALKALLVATSEEIQNRGWWFNREYEMILAPDQQGRVIIPQNILQIDPVNPADDLVTRGQFLYDRSNTTNVISKSVTVDTITYLEWDELPFAAQSAIQYQAAMTYVGGDDGDADEFNRLRLKFDTAFAELKRANLRAEDVSVRTNRTVSRVMARRRNRVSTRFGGAASPG